MFHGAVLVLSFLLLIPQAFSQNIHGNRSHYAEYDPSGKYIALGGEDIILLNSLNQEVRVLNQDNPEGLTLSFSNDGRYLAAETRSFNIYVYDLQSPNKAPIFFQGLDKKDSLQSRLKFSPDNTMLATSNADKLVIYDLSKGKEGNVLLTVGIDPANSQRSIAAFDATPDWKTFFFNMQVIHIEKDASGKLSSKYGRIINGDGMVANLSLMSSDGKQVVLAGRKGSEQRVYDLNSGDLLMRNTNLQTYALAANKDFSKIYMNQAIWDLKSQNLQRLNQRQNVDKNSKNQISVSPVTGEFMIGLYQYNNEGQFKENLQVELTVFNRVEINGDQALFYRDYANSNKFDVHVAIISEGLRGRSNRNLTNNKKLNTALATSPDGSYGINHMARIIRKDSMTVSSPIFPVGRYRGLAAAISEKNLVALVNQQRIFLYEFPEGIAKMNTGKALESIILKKAIPANAKVDLKLSPDNSQIALTVTSGSSSEISLYTTGGELVKTISAEEVNDVAFTFNSQRFYYTSGKRLNCLSKDIQDGKTMWFRDDTYSFYADSGKIIAIALSRDDSMLAYTTHNGWNKVVRARYGVDVITCVIQPNNRLDVSKN